MIDLGDGRRIGHRDRPGCGPTRRRIHRPARPFLAEAAWSVGSAILKPLFACFNDTRSCGRRGPARLGSTVPRSSSIVSRVGRILVAGDAEQALRFRIGLDEVDVRLLAAGQPQVVERHLVDREDRDRRAVFRTHVAERGPVGNREVLEARPEELDELADDAVLAQAFGDREHQIGGCRAFEHRAGQPEAEHRGNQHRDRLTEHRGLCLDAADAPADHAEPVDHRRVRIGADQRVGIHGLLAASLPGHHHAGEVFEVHLVHDAGIGRHDAEIAERILSPAQERVPLLVARELELRVQLKRIRLAEVVDLDRVIDHQLHRLQRVDATGVAAEPHDAVAHRREIDHRRHAGEVLQQHAGWSERDLPLSGALHVPPRERLDVGRLDEAAVLVAEQVLEENLQRVR